MISMSSVSFSNPSCTSVDLTVVLVARCFLVPNSHRAWYDETPTPVVCVVAVVTTITHILFLLSVRSS